MDFPYVLIVWPPYLSCAKKCSSEIPLVFPNIGIEVFSHRVTYSFAHPLMSVYSLKVQTCLKFLKQPFCFFWRGTVEVDNISSSDIGF